MSARPYTFRLKGSDKLKQIVLNDGENLKIARPTIARELSIDESIDDLVFIVSGQILNDKSKFSELSKSQLPDDGFILVVQRPAPDLRTPRSLRGQAPRAAEEEEDGEESPCELPPEGPLRDTIKHLPQQEVTGGQDSDRQGDKGQPTRSNDSGDAKPQEEEKRSDESSSSNKNDSGDREGDTYTSSSSDSTDASSSSDSTDASSSTDSTDASSSSDSTDASSSSDSTDASASDDDASSSDDDHEDSGN